MMVMVMVMLATCRQQYNDGDGDDDHDEYDDGGRDDGNADDVWSIITFYPPSVWRTHQAWGHFCLTQSPT